MQAIAQPTIQRLRRACGSAGSRIALAMATILAVLLLGTVASSFAAPLPNVKRSRDGSDASAAGMPAGAGMMPGYGRAEMAPPMPMMVADAMGSEGGTYKSTSRSASPMHAAVSSMLSINNEGSGQIQLNEPMIVKTGHMSSEVPNVEHMITMVEEMVSAAKGRIDSSNRNNADQGWGRAGLSADMQIRIPSAAFDASVSKLRDMVKGEGGRVLSESINARDASSEYIDARSRESTETASLEQMRTLLTSAVNVDEVLAVKREMDQITSRLESAKGQRKYLESVSEYSTLSLQLYTLPPKHSDPSAWSIGRTFSEAFQALGVALQALVTLFIFGGVFALPLLVAAAAAALILAFCFPAAYQSLSATACCRTGRPATRDEPDSAHAS